MIFPPFIALFIQNPTFDQPVNCTQQCIASVRRTNFWIIRTKRRTNEYWYICTASISIFGALLKIRTTLWH